MFLLRVSPSSRPSCPAVASNERSDGNRDGNRIELKLTLTSYTVATFDSRPPRDPFHVTTLYLRCVTPGASTAEPASAPPPRPRGCRERSTVAEQHRNDVELKERPTDRARQVVDRPSLAQLGCRAGLLGRCWAVTEEGDP